MAWDPSEQEIADAVARGDVAWLASVVRRYLDSGRQGAPSPRSTILLASGSPRRRELMQGLGFGVVVRTAGIPEVRHPDESPRDYALRLARAKAEAVAAIAPSDDPRWILAADTIVVHDGAVLEKPVDPADARAMLRRLSGAVHSVITAFCWLNRETSQLHTQAVETTVEFRELDDASIDAYVASGEPLDKAGAYGIQGLAAAFVAAIGGSYTCVVGLPVCEVVASLQRLGGIEEFPFR